MDSKDFYQVLGVSRNANADDIKRAYRLLARKYHPDRSKAADAEARFKEVSEAYEVLRDPATRNDYDRLGSRWRGGQNFNTPPDRDRGFDAGPSSAGSGAGRKSFGDFFEGMFARRDRQDSTASRAGAGARPKATGRATGAPPHRGPAEAHDARRHGADIHAKVAIELEDAYRGVRQAVNLKQTVIGPDKRPVERDRTIEVSIPKGVRAGQQIRVAGQGGEPASKGQTGDLYLEIELRPHRLYSVEGRDVTLELPVTPSELVLGANVTAPTPLGSIELTIPENSVPGRRLRLRGRGIPGHQPGDFFVVLRVALPPAINEAAREAYRQFEKSLPFDPRTQLN